MDKEVAKRIEFTAEYESTRGYYDCTVRAYNTGDSIIYEKKNLRDANDADEAFGKIKRDHLDYSQPPELRVVGIRNEIGRFFVGRSLIVPEVVKFANFLEFMRNHPVYEVKSTEGESNQITLANPES